MAGKTASRTPNLTSCRLYSISHFIDLDGCFGRSWRGHFGNVVDFHRFYCYYADACASDHYRGNDSSAAGIGPERRSVRDRARLKHLLLPTSGPTSLSSGLLAPATGLPKAGARGR